MSGNELPGIDLDFETFLERELEKTRRTHPADEEPSRLVARRAFYSTHYERLCGTESSPSQSPRDAPEEPLQRTLRLRVPVAALELGQEIYERYVKAMPTASHRYRVVVD